MFPSRAHNQLEINTNFATILDKTTQENIERTTLYNKTISKSTALHKENPLPQFNVAYFERPGMRGQGEGRIATATMFRKMLSKYAILAKALSKIVRIYGPV